MHDKYKNNNYRLSSILYDLSPAIERYFQISQISASAYLCRHLIQNPCKKIHIYTYIIDI